MASGDCDHIEVMELSIAKKANMATGPSGSDDDDRDRLSIAEKNVPYDPAVGPSGAISKVHKSDRKIGHRRVGEGGEITYKKIQSSQIMGSIQLGIQHAIGGLASKPERDLLMQDFMTVETTNFPSEGSNHTPAHHYSEFKFKTYAPIAFRYFRDLFGIQPDDFLMSMCSASLRELSNPGASGSIFYLTTDDEFIIKTVQHKEGEFLQKLLPGYYLNLDQNPRTLLPKFFGLYCYQCNSKNVRLVAMNNLLPSSVKLHQKYDLKGSTYKRKASKSERQKNSPTYKDLDFMEHHAEGIFLEADTYTALIKTMQRDCRVLESFKIMDYSLLVGIHNLDEGQREKSEARKRNDSHSDDEDGDKKGLNRTRSEQSREEFKAQVKRTQSINRQRLVAHSTAMESIQAESEPIDEEEDVPPGGIPARNARGERLLLFLGIIDILQSYRLRKKLEHTWKSMIHDGDTVSVHRPSFYAQRFLDFMGKTVFKKIPSSLKHSPSKRKSIAKPSRPIEEVDTPGPLHVPPIRDYNPDYMKSPRSSVRSSHSDFTDTTISTYHRQTEYPSVLSDRLRVDRTFRRTDYDTKLQIREATDTHNGLNVLCAGSSRMNDGSLTDSGIQADASAPQINTETIKILKDASVDTRNDDNLQDIPFIDEDDKRTVRYKSASNIPQIIETDERLSMSLNRAKSPTFVEKFKKFFADIGLVRSGEHETRNSLDERTSNTYELRETSTLPKDMRFRKVRSTQTVYIKPESPFVDRVGYEREKQYVSVVKLNGDEYETDTDAIGTVGVKGTERVIGPVGVGGVTDRVILTEGVGGVTDRVILTEGVGGVTDRVIFTEGVGGVTDRVVFTEGVGGVTERGTQVSDRVIQIGGVGRVTERFIRTERGTQVSDGVTQVSDGVTQVSDGVIQIGGVGRGTEGVSRVTERVIRTERGTQVSDGVIQGSERVINEIVYVKSLDKSAIYMGNASGSTIIFVPPAD